MQYIALAAGLNLIWEILQLPLYTLWSEARPGAMAFAVVHCTAGDILIAACSCTIALVLVGSKQWPGERFRPVALLAITFGFLYTVFSKWNNTVVTRAWSYSTLMPTVWGIGLSPLAQWLVIPGFVFWCLRPHLKPEGAHM